MLDYEWSSRSGFSLIFYSVFVLHVFGFFGFLFSFFF